ncbi:MAG: HD domain-containing protein [Clostridiales bacterium]|nr:HD domain-containing protein [Clostridiales bacterium]
MKYTEILDRLLLSDNVVHNFYTEYEHNAEFRNALDHSLPEVRKCEEQRQNNPWHKYNVLGHILHSVQAINFQTTDLPPEDRKLLAYTMFFHDMGKPKCHIERMKDGKMIDSFFNHNIESAKIAKAHASEFGFNDTETNVLEKLVLDHDIFMYIKDYPTTNPHWKTLSYDVINDEISSLNTVGDGTKLMRYLIMVGRADNLAQNEKMTADSLAMLDKMDHMLDEREKERI